MGSGNRSNCKNEFRSAGIRCGLDDAGGADGMEAVLFKREQCGNAAGVVGNSGTGIAV